MWVLVGFFVKIVRFGMFGDYRGEIVYMEVYNCLVCYVMYYVCFGFICNVFIINSLYMFNIFVIFFESLDWKIIILF